MDLFRVFSFVMKKGLTWYGIPVQCVGFEDCADRKQTGPNGVKSGYSLHLFGYVIQSRQCLIDDLLPIPRNRYVSTQIYIMVKFRRVASQPGDMQILQQLAEVRLSSVTQLNWKGHSQSREETDLKASVDGNSPLHKENSLWMESRVQQRFPVSIKAPSHETFRIVELRLELCRQLCR